jgi:hypothetical protein
VAQLKNVVDPFGEVNVYPTQGGKTRVVATILMEPHREGAQTGIALDGSGSMAKLYGVDDGSRILSPLFGGPKKRQNEITPVAQQICAYLARKLDADGGTTVIYWAVGAGGSEVEVVGDFRAEQAEKHTFGPPADFGTGTQLLPAVRYFVDRFKNAPFGFYAFITDGEIHDLDEVKEYSTRLARDIPSRRRAPVKFVLVGVGDAVDEAQMEELDDLDTGTDIDLWDHKLAAEMRVLQEIFAEVVDKNARVAPNGRILDGQGKVVKDYSTAGLPAYLEFEVPAGSDHFVLEVNGQKVTQPLTDRARPAAAVAASPIPVVEPVPVAPAAPAAPAQPQMNPDEPVDEVPVEDDPTAAEWKSLPMEFDLSSGNNDPDDVGLEEHEKDK